MSLELRGQEVLCPGFDWIMTSQSDYLSLLYHVAGFQYLYDILSMCQCWCTGSFHDNRFSATQLFNGFIFSNEITKKLCVSVMRFQIGPMRYNDAHLLWHYRITKRLPGLFIFVLLPSYEIEIADIGIFVVVLVYITS